MSYQRRTMIWLSGWIDDVAAAVLLIAAKFRSTRRFQFVEQSNGSFLVEPVSQRFSSRATGELVRIVDARIVDPLTTELQGLLAGAAINVALLPRRFMFRPLDLPSRASEFIEGIVQSQIDRLTPWSAGEAAFGWSPAEVVNERLSVTIAATARTLVAPIIEAISDLHPASIALSTTSEDAAGQLKRIDIFNQRTAHEHGIRRIRRWLLVIAAAAGCAALVATAAWLIAGEELDSEQAALTQRLAERRAAVNNSHAGPADDAVEFLERKKRENPPGVMVLDTLSQILPDDTYLTELHMEGGKIQISGLTHDAPALIRLIEQSQYFAQATFFAPTTRSPDQREERFHIEAQIKPLFGAP